MKRFYRGEDAAHHCLKDLQEVSLLIQPLLNQYPDHNLTVEEEVEYQQTKK
jgi:exonuclease VII small subunit